jgi:hypothetical protein
MPSKAEAQLARILAASPSMPTSLSHPPPSEKQSAMDFEKRQEQNKNIRGGPGAGLSAFEGAGKFLGD